jgi:hypothetical protein
MLTEKRRGDLDGSRAEAGELLRERNICPQDVVRRALDT